jgi:hypothetical protein
MVRRATWTLLTALAAVALVSACSDTPSAPTPTTSTAPTTHGAFGECLREHGVADPPHSPFAGPPAGVDQGTWDSAMRACGSLAPAAPGPG